VLLNFLTLGILVIVVWISSGFFLMKALFAHNEFVTQSIMLSVPYRITSGILLFILIMMVYYLIVYSRNLKEKIRNEAKLQTLVKEAELNMLKSQINPHFLFNSLNSVSSLTLNDPAGAREMIIKLSEFLRYSLKHTERNRNPLKDEIENIRRYLDIEKVRFGDKLQFNFGCDELSANWLVPNMILQPLFENAVKHGVYESTEPVRIEMNCNADEGFLVIRIRNNFDKDSPGRRGAGIGLKNIRERLKLLYGRDDLLQHSKEDGAFTVKLMIPHHENKSTDHRR
jgi:LytS/YehU family sensor histidine kinase